MFPLLILLLLSHLPYPFLANIQVTCHADRMSVLLESAQSVDKYTLIDSSTDPTQCETSSASTLINIPLNACGTRKSVNDTHILFHNVLTGAQETRVSAVINRGPLLVTVVKCLYSRYGATGVVNWVSGTPIPDEAAIAAMEYGMTIYRGYENDTLTGEYVKFPIALYGDDLLYVDIAFDMEFATETTLNLYVAVEELFFSTSVNAENTLAFTYDVVKDGCVVDEGDYQEITQEYFSTSVSINTTTILTNATELLYLHSLVKLCDDEDADFATCMATCETTDGDSAKRDLDKFFAEFHLYIGEFDPKIGQAAKGAGYRVTVPFALIAGIILAYVL